jgi:hypothetical protein
MASLLPRRPAVPLAIIFLGGSYFSLGRNF